MSQDKVEFLTLSKSDLELIEEFDKGVKGELDLVDNINTENNEMIQSFPKQLSSLQPLTLSSESSLTPYSQAEESNFVSITSVHHELRSSEIISEEIHKDLSKKEKEEIVTENNFPPTRVTTTTTTMTPSFLQINEEIVDFKKMNAFFSKYSSNEHQTQEILRLMNSLKHPVQQNIHLQLYTMSQNYKENVKKNLFITMNKNIRNQQMNKVSSTMEITEKSEIDYSECYSNNMFEADNSVQVNNGIDETHVHVPVVKKRKLHSLHPN